MRTILLSLFLFGIMSNPFAQAQPTLRVMSFNLRLHVESDGKNAWPKRTELVESMIRFHAPDVIGVQEALQGQMDQLEQMLPDYASYGVARDTGKWAEYSAIWYRRSRLEWLDGATLWLSETPEVSSQGWDASMNRIVTYAKFRDKHSGQVFFHFNTHFDHRGEIARRESAKLLLRKAKELNPDELPVLVTGDFNANPSSEPYAVLTGSPDYPPFLDAWEHSQQAPHGPASTWSGFSTAGEPGRRIDYVFFQHRVVVNRIASLAESWSGRFPSDHLPVLAEVWLNPTQALPQAHAHNDYEHDRPLYEALEHGFGSIEVDVWLLEGQIYVAHDRPNTLLPEKTLQALYLDPLANWVSEQDGKVYPGSASPLFLMIDLKNEGKATYEQLKIVLADYEWLLKGDHPAVRIFLSGSRVPAQIQADPERILGIDGRPDDLGKGYTAEEMPVISQRYGKLLNWSGKGEMSEAERKKLTELCAAAHAEGKKVRLWATPESEVVWQALQEVGVDFLNTDDLSRLQAFLIR